MRNNKGQALIEFVILIPVFMMLILGMLDLGNIMYHKYQLSNDLDFISDLYIENKENDIISYANKQDIKYQIRNDNNKVKIIVSEKIKINTPGLNNILGNYYNISVERMLYNES